MSEGNIKRLVTKLTKMRGAALKIGQFLSIQGGFSGYFCRPCTYLMAMICPAHVLILLFSDSHVLPPEVEEIFRRVQDSAHYMPDWQMEVSSFIVTNHVLAELFVASDAVVTWS